MAAGIWRRRAAAMGLVGATALLAGCLAPGTPDGWSSYTIEAGAHSPAVDRPPRAARPKAGWYGNGGAP
ncbi:MAG: hypothetical protein KDA97_12580, partial [Acidimicrobiales bacterium]|nr:hypothetical protein [Acidimicrobiales bacterium]